MPDLSYTAGREGGRAAERHFRDSKGEFWRVSERVQDTDDDPRRCLVFVSDTAARRVRHYPENWHELSETELERLSWSR